MTTVQFRTESTVKQQCSDLFQALGITMSDAINLFLRQAILHGGLPFEVKLPYYNEATRAAITDAKQSKGEKGRPAREVLAELKIAAEDDDE